MQIHERGDSVHAGEGHVGGHDGASSPGGKIGCCVIKIKG